MSAVRLLAVFAENKPGQTASITKMLSEAHINIRWVTIANSGSFGVMKLLVADPDHAHDVLEQNGVMARLLDVIPVEVMDQPGALHAVVECLARDKINLDNTSGFVANEHAIVLIETHDIERASATLRKEGFRVLTREELLRI